METTEQSLIRRLKPKLEDYLILKGVKFNGNMFSCISPEHNDSDPSASIGGGFDKTLFNCFGCDASGDIFAAANLLDGMPIGSDPLFYSITLKTLAKLMLDEDYTPRDLSDEDKDRITYYRLYKDVSDIITNFTTTSWDKDVQFIRDIKDRGITLESVTDFGIGGIPSIEAYKDAVLRKGWTLDDMFDMKVLSRDERLDKIFDTGKIIITIKNADGRPVAFVSRKVEWSKGDPHAKYVNTDGTQIYSKNKTFFGLDLAKSVLRKKPLILVEGYIDVITLRQAGIKNIAGLGSATLRVDSIDEIIAENENKKGRNKIILDNIVLCFDNDKGGNDCTRRSVEDLGKRPNISTNIKEIPTGFNDPDEIIRKTDRKFFDDIELITPFKWLLKHKTTEESDEIFVKRVCQEISNEDSPFARKTKARDLADLVKFFTIDDIIAEIDHQRGEMSSQMNADMEKIFAVLDKKRRGANGADNVKITQEAIVGLKRVMQDYNQRHGDAQELYSKQIDVTINEFNKTRGMNGFKMKGFPQLEQALDGMPDKECLIAVAGDSNIGKSTWMREISWDVAKSNRDAIVLYMSIDDSTRDVLQAIVAREAEEARNVVNKLGFQRNDDIIDGIEDAWDFVKKQTNYIVVDSTQGSTVMHMQDHIDYMKKKFPNKKPIVFLDNFHKLKTPAGTALREKFVDLSQTLKDITQEYDIPIVMTVELRKGDNRNNNYKPSLNDIAETKQIEYDAKIIMLCHQEMHYVPETAISWHRDTYHTDRFSPNGETKMPYLHMRISKNKHTATKMPFAYKFETDKSILTEMDYITYEELERQEAERVEMSRRS